MLLSKIAAWRPFRLWRDYAAWLAFCAILLGLTNAAASLDKIRAYGFQSADIFLTFGFLIAWGIAEAAAAAAALTLAQVWLEQTAGKKLDAFFRLLAVAAFAACWVLLLLTILRWI